MVMLTLLVACDEGPPPTAESRARYAEEERQRLAAARAAILAQKAVDAAPEPMPDAGPPLTAKQKAAAEKLMAKEEAKMRSSMADMFEQNMRANGIAAIVRATGSQNRTLLIRWVGCDEVQLDVLTEDQQQMAGLRRIGFKRVDCSNGYQVWYQPL